jgi:hypothetical protein
MAHHVGFRVTDSIVSRVPITSAGAGTDGKDPVCVTVREHVVRRDKKEEFSAPIVDTLHYITSPDSEPFFAEVEHCHRNKLCLHCGSTKGVQLIELGKYKIFACMYHTDTVKKTYTILLDKYKVVDFRLCPEIERKINAYRGREHSFKIRKNGRILCGWKFLDADVLTNNDMLVKFDGKWRIHMTHVDSHGNDMYAWVDIVTVFIENKISTNYRAYIDILETICINRKSGLKAKIG